MLKSAKILILTSCLMVAAPSFAVEPNNENRQEMRALKMEQAKLKIKEKMLKLKQALNLQPKQMDAWAAYESHALKNVDNKIQMVSKLRKKRAETKKPPSSIDLAKANIARLENQLTTAKDKLVVFSKFYKVLNDEQKTTIDKLALKKVKHAASKVRKSHKKKMKKDGARRQTNKN